MINAMYELALYITGETPRSREVIRKLSVLLEKELPGQYSLKVIDILENPELAEEDGILATPTLIRTGPAPERRMVGDFSDAKKVLAGMQWQ